LHWIGVIKPAWPLRNWNPTEEQYRLWWTLCSLMKQVGQCYGWWRLPESRLPDLFRVREYRNPPPIDSADRLELAATRLLGSLEARNATAEPPKPKASKPTRRKRGEVIEAIHNAGQDHHLPKNAPMNRKPIQVRELADKLGVSHSCVSDFFSDHFSDHESYCRFCFEADEYEFLEKMTDVFCIRSSGTRSVGVAYDSDQVALAVDPRSVHCNQN
jgi:hypothetical protein